MPRMKSQSVVGAVLVVGGGISGIEAALNSAELGFKVYLVEQSPILGGKMAQLDKTFPTCDCSMCILSPKLIECDRHPNIDILTLTKVKSVQGEAGNFKISLIKKPRYIDEGICVGCGLCALYCPATAPDSFNQDLSFKKAINITCPQSVPVSSIINPDYCIFLKENKCQICKGVCKQGAIDFSQNEEEFHIEVGAIILSPGADIFEAGLVPEYGYGRIKNVMNSLEFERLLNADGPFHGEILRPSDGRVPRKIAWLQCVGSRDKRLGRTYCSAVCCTYAIKQIVLAKGYYPDLHATVFFMDMRTFGKGFEDFYNKARVMEGVRFVRSRVASIMEAKGNGDLILEYFSDVNGRAIEEVFDMVVLSVGLAPLEENRSIAQVTGIELNNHGFGGAADFSRNVGIARPGIFPAGTFTGPMDIPDSISSATAAVSQASQLLSSKRGSLVKPRLFPKEVSTSQEVPKIGVFVCNCGANIGRVVNVSSVVEYAATLNNVAYCEENLFSCSADAGRGMASKVRENGLNRVVVAACTPRTHEPLFQDTLREAGINKYLFEMANIREHCSWVHSREKDSATEKAKDLVAMAVARAACLSPLREIELPVTKKALILGGGLAGMRAALALARQGFETWLVEKEAELGGNLRNLYFTLDGMDIQHFLRTLKREVEIQNNLTVLTGYELQSVSGSVGNFKSVLVRVSQGGGEDPRRAPALDFDHGITVVATGGKVLEPTEYHYGKSKRVVTQQEFERMIYSRTSVRHLKRVAMIQCVGARNEARPYCSRICCGQAVKNALKLKELNDNVDIFVFYRDIRTYGFMEDYFALAREKGILFIRYEPDRKPELNIERGRLSLNFHESVLGRQAEIEPDLLVLSTPIVPNGNRELARRLKVPVTRDGFFMEAHMKLRPLDFASDGVFLCGMAHYPRFIGETINQADGAVARAAAILSKDTIISGGAICEVDEKRCKGCGLCLKACPFDAIELHRAREGEKARIVPAVCKGCGVCSSKCPAGAIVNSHFSDHQILSQIGAAYSVPIKKSEPKILGFLCNWCGYAGADLAGVSRIQYAPNLRVIRVMCSGRIHPKFFMEAFLNGIDGVLVAGCHLEDCHYLTGINETVKTVRKAKKELEAMGINSDRLRLEHISAGEGERFAEIVDAFTEAMKALDPLDLSFEQKAKMARLKSQEFDKEAKTAVAHGIDPDA